MKIMIAAVFYFLYWGVCFLGTGTDRKNLIGLRSYPDEVQTRVQSDPQLGQAVPKAKSTAAILLSNLLLFTVVFSVLGLALKSVLGLNNYLSAFWYFLAFGEGLGLFDTYGGIYPEEIAALQRDYAALWGPLSDLLKKLSALVEL